MTQATARLVKAREDFLSSGNLAAAVRPDITASWKRSRLWGAVPDARSLPFTEEINSEGRFARAARPVLDHLAAQLASTTTAILLADAEARVVARWADDDMRSLLDRTNSAPGFSLREDVCGTNGLGSVLEEQRPFFVLGAEHFSEQFMNYACYGAPIRHPLTRRIMGILTFACEVKDSSPVMLGFVQSTCEAIEERMRNQVTASERGLLDAFLSAGRQTRRPVVAVMEQTIISSPAASRLLDGFDQSALWDIAERSIHDGRPLEAAIDGLDGRALSVQARPVYDGGHALGALVELAGLPVLQTRSSVPGTVHPQQSLRERLGGSSRSWTQALAAAARAAGTSDPVLLVGEPGTGKIELGSALHEVGGRPGDLRTVNAALAAVDGLSAWFTDLRAQLSLPGTLLISHLESLGDREAQALAALLDAQAGAASRVIGTATRTGHDVEPAGPHLDRLAVHRIDVPPLRDRTEDIPELVPRVLARHGHHGVRVRSEVIQVLRRADWPGNVRQLGLVLRAAMAGRGTREITLGDLPAELHETSARSLTNLERVELQAIVTAMRRAGGNKKVAAQDLGVSRSTLYRKLREFHLDLGRTAY